MLFCCLSVLIALQSCCCLFSFADAATRTAVLMSDIHYDPYYGTGKAYRCSAQSALRDAPYGSIGCDTPAALLSSAVGDAVSLAPTDVYVCGDWLRHGMDELPSSDISPTLSGVASQVSTFLDIAPTSSSRTVAWSLGNDDVVPSYHLNVSKLLQLRPFGTVMESSRLISAAERATFEDCGYYFRDVFALRLRIIVLNTLLWSTDIVPSMAPSDDDPCRQLWFLKSSLDGAVAATLKTVIVGHIPPGLDVHDAVRNGFQASAMFWVEGFQASFVALVAAYANNISFMLFGHTHTLSFIADPVVLPTIPIFLVPSISPIFGNNPSYLIATVDDTSGSIQRLRHRVFSMDTTSWSNGPELSTTFNVDLGNVSQLAALAQSLAAGANPAQRETFISMYTSNGDRASIFLGGSCNGACARILYCAMSNIRYADIRKCTNLPEYSALRSASPVTIVFTVISSLVFGAAIVFLVYHRQDLMAVPAVALEVRSSISVPRGSRQSVASSSGPVGTAGGERASVGADGCSRSASVTSAVGKSTLLE